MILYTDKTELFECNVNVDGASIDNTKARIIIEGKKWNLVFYGNIENDGKCKINIGNLNIFNEGDNGKIKLEIIADDTVFIPWQDDFNVKTSKKVTVEVVSKNSFSNTLSESQKTQVSVNVQIPQLTQQENSQTSTKNPEKLIESLDLNSKKDFLAEMTKDLKRHNISPENIRKNKSLLMNTVLSNMKKFKINENEINWVIESATDIINGNFPN